MGLTGNPFLDALLIAAAVLTALGVIWRKALRPIIRAARKTEEVLPVLMDIAQQFRANGGSSLRDAIESIISDGATLSEYAHAFKHDFVNRFTVMVGELDLLKEQVEALAIEVALIKKMIDRRSKTR